MIYNMMCQKKFIGPNVPSVSS